jgi:preprotein translocase subunit SecD
MKRMFLVLTATSLLVADIPVLNGKWRVHRSAAGRESEQECTFSQNAGVLTGSCAQGQGTVALNGKVEGDHVTWTIKTESEGGPVTVVYDGKIDSASKLSGKVTAVEFSIEGEFTATRAN